MTEVRPQTAAIEMRALAHPMPTLSKALAIGELSLIWLYLCIPGTTKLTPT